jgi:hypothetical protein
MVLGMLSSRSQCGKALSDTVGAPSCTASLSASWMKLQIWQAPSQATVWAVEGVELIRRSCG